MKTRIICLFLAAILLVALPACGTASRSANTSGADETEIRHYEAEDARYDGKVPVGGSVAQIVGFYNNQANAVKAADRITIKMHDVSEMDIDVPSMLRARLPSDTENLDSSKNETITETFVHGKGTNDVSLTLNDFLPVKGKHFVSQLETDHVQSASCAEQDDGWVVTINLKDEPLDMSVMAAYSTDMSEAERQSMMDDFLLKSGYGSSMKIELGSDLLRDRGNTQDRQRPGFAGSMSMEGGFQDGVIIAVFDKDSQLISLTHSYHMNMGTSVIGMKISMNTVAKQEYQFTW